MAGAVNAIRLSEAERKVLLDAITTKANASPLAAKRRDTRYALPPGYSVLGEFFMPGGATQKAIVSLRDISRGGLAMLYGNYIHVGTKSMFVVCDAERKPVATASGEVVRCAHVKGTIHDVGIRFAAPLPLEALLRVTSSEEATATSASTYPALMALCDDLVQLVRTGAPLDQIRQMLLEMNTALQEAHAAKPSAPSAAA